MSLKFNLINQWSVSLDVINGTEMCNECELDKVSNACNKCGNGVCTQPMCQYTFQYKFNTTMVICKGCFDEIDNKLINYDHLIVYKFLKKNVRKRRISC